MADLNASVLARLDAMVRRFDEIEAELANPAGGFDQVRFTALVKERAQLEETAATYRRYRKTLDELERAQKMDRRLWAYLTAQIFNSKDHGPKEKLLSQTEMSRGSDDWLGCKRRSPDKPAEDLLICRESQGCLIDARFSFLPL